MDTIKANIEAHKVADEIVELGFQLIRESNFSAEQVRHAWLCVSKAALNIVGEDKKPQKKAKKKQSIVKEHSRRTRLHDDHLMPWGVHKDKRLGDVPGSYWRWFLSQEWAVNYPDLHQYAALTTRDDDDR